MSQTNWGDTHDHPYSEAINNFYGPFGNGYVPLFAVIGNDYKVVYCDNNVSPLTSKINQALNTFDLQLLQTISSFILEGDEISFDMEDYFTSISGSTISYSVDSSNPDVLATQFNGNILTLSRVTQTNEGISIIDITATAGNQTRHLNFEIGVFVPAPIAGFGKCVEFKNGGFLQGSTGGTLNSIETISFEGWINYEESTSNLGLISKTGGTTGWYCYIMSNGIVKFYIKTVAGSRKVFSETEVPAGEWHHIACTYDGLVAKLYIDGELDNTNEYTTYSAINNTTTANLKIGSDASNTFIGKMDDFSLWSRALTSDEVQSFMNRIILENQDGLISSWTFDSKFGNIATDLNSTYNLTLKSLSNSAWVKSDISPLFTVLNETISSVLPYNELQSGYEFSTVNTPSHGSLNINSATGEFTYNAESGFIGMDTFSYKIYDGSFYYSDEIIVNLDVKSVGIEENLASSSQIIGNYPNPFNPETTISYKLVCDSNVKITLFNGNGELVKTYNVGQISQGTHSFKIKIDDLNSGAYWYSLNINGNIVDTSKMVLIK
ncbi:MAG: T9SS type A sorting domain-containing protein [Candidatus Delongbacteria bacterium]|nr:T9SS type A sorting domain-containing protein [Candidatus Delongbacteria bacterium]